MSLVRSFFLDYAWALTSDRSSIPEMCRPFRFEPGLPAVSCFGCEGMGIEEEKEELK
jgi:hypothetical protein